MKKHYIIVLVALQFACTSAEKNPSESVNDGEHKLSKFIKSDIPAEEVFKWRSEFSGRPDADISNELVEKADQVVDKESSSVADLLKAGNNLLAIGNYGKATVVAKQVLTRDAANIDALMLLAKINLSNNNYRAAEDALDKVKRQIILGNEKNEYTEMIISYLEGIISIKQNNISRGHELLAGVIRKNDRFLPAYEALSSSYVAMGQLDVAEFVIYQGIDKAGESAKCFNILGVIAGKRGEYEQATSLYNKAISLDSSFVSPLVNRANLNIKRMELDLAEQNLIKALGIDPKNDNAMVSMSIVYKKTGRFIKSREYLEQALAFNPSNVHARLNLGILLKNVFKENSMAYRYFKEVINISSSNSDISKMAKLYLNEISPEEDEFTELR